MSKKPETLFREKVRRDLAELPHSWFESIQQQAIRGSPDLLGSVAGFFVALELKKDAKAKVDPLQLHKIDLIERTGALAFIVYPENWGDIYQRLKAIAEGKVA